MKKYTLFSIVFILFLILIGSLGLNTKIVNAFDSGCFGSNLYSITTGRLCSISEYEYNYSNYSYGCTSAGPYNTITGQLCNSSQYYNYNQPPVISSVSSSSGRVGNQITIYGRGFNANICNVYPCVNNGNTINFGLSIIPNAYSADGTSMTFTIPAFTNSACLYTNPACVIPQYQNIPGTYPIFVTNMNGTSNTVNFSLSY